MLNITRKSRCSIRLNGGKVLISLSWVLKVPVFMHVHNEIKLLNQRNYFYKFVKFNAFVIPQKQINFRHDFELNTSILNQEIISLQPYLSTSIDH